MFTGNRKLITIYSLSFVNVQQLLCCEQRPRKIIFRRLYGGDATLCRITVDIRCAPQVGPLTTYAKTQCPVPGPNRRSRTGKLKPTASSRARKLKDTASSRVGSSTRHKLKVWQAQGHGKLKGWFLNETQPQGLAISRTRQAQGLVPRPDTNHRPADRRKVRVHLCQDSVSLHSSDVVRRRYVRATKHDRLQHRLPTDRPCPLSRRPVNLLVSSLLSVSVFCPISPLDVRLFRPTSPSVMLPALTSELLCLCRPLTCSGCQ